MLTIVSYPCILIALCSLLFSMVVEQDCDRSKLTDMVSDIVPGAALSRAYSKELAFKLPMKSVATFPGQS